MSKRLFGLLGKASAPAESTVPKRAYLLTIDIFRDLPPEIMAMLDAQTRLITSPKGRVLYAQEERAEALFLLKRGRVQLYRLTPHGKRLDLATLEPGTFFGEMPLLGESLRHAYAESIEESVLCVMSRTDVERLIVEQPRVALRMMEALAQRLALAEARLEEMAYRGVAARIAAVLLRLEHERGGVTVAITHQELGDMVGALRETVTKTLDEFQDQALVELGRGKITLRDPNGLRDLLDE
jgi:CRP/FNR family transcriptional regulator, cyclic AMP receptor protein